MESIKPDDLLNSAITRSVAPWCATLDNLELGIALLAQPWIQGAGLRRSDFERQLSALASSLPLGHVYFQRINRVVSNLESRGVLLGLGDDRDRRFVLAPEGFAALILNLHVLQADPTLDGREFEFKLELVAHWNLTLDRLLTSMPDIVPPSSMQSFFERFEQLTVLGKPVITLQVIKDAFSLTRLIGHQRANVTRLKSQAEARLTETHALTEFLRTADLSQLNLEGLTDQASLLRESPGLQEVLRTIATSGAPQLNARAQIIRYEAYLDYLERLEGAYLSQLKIVDINLFRRRIAGAGG